MLNALIATKFHNPIPMGRLTARPRLDAHLDESLLPGCRLVLVTAPAGFGKSTLMSAWLRKRDMPFAWLSLDSGDNEPRVFLSYLVGALQKIHPNLGMTLVNRIQTADSSDSEAVYADVLASLVNEIAALPEPFMLVLDDGHLLKNPQVLKLLNFLVERQPAQLRLALLTREDLPLPVARLRVRRQMVEIRQADLQFTAEEAADFLREGMGLHLSPADILALEQRTEGWIAGLQLAALSMRYDPDPARFIDSFTGSDRYILDYLLDEVFTHQPEAVQNFLLGTSILDPFCAPLCDAVVEALNGAAAGASGAAAAPPSTPGGANGQSRIMLELVERSNLFLIPLDHHREWYRYHHLFADLLRHALENTAPDKVPALHLRASQWFEANGFVQEAVKHAFQTRDWLYAAELVERNGWSVILHSQVGLVSDWCATFPEAVIRKRPALCVLHAWALIVTFREDNLPAAEARIQQAEASLADFDPETRAALVSGAPPVRLHTWVSGQITMLRSFTLMMAPRRQADPQALIDLGQLSYDCLPVEDIPARSAGLLDICYADQARSNAHAAEKKFEQVITLALSGGNYFGAVVADYHRAHGKLALGKLREVIEFCQQKKAGYEAYFTHPIQEMPAIALLDQAMGTALLELNEMDAAEQALRRGLEVGQWMPREELPGYLALARLCIAKGDPRGQAETLRRLDMRWPDIRYCTQAVRILTQLRAQPDDPSTRAAAAEWAAAHPPEIGPEIVTPGIGPAWNDEADYAVYVAWAQVQILLGRADEALGVIQPMLEVAQANELLHRVIELLLLQAQAYYTRGDRSRCWQSLSPALLYAEREGYLRLVDHGPLLVRILTEAAGLGIAPRYIACLLAAGQQSAPDGAALFVTADAAAITTPAPAPHPSFGLGGLVEPLSARESEVLGLMALGLSNAEIAARLYLSPNTMKTHTQNIYGKLDVHSRVQAVNKARELKII